ncbi:glycosyltransferase [Chryseobacterium sp. SSA4.19]|uniref:glycosyltransferase n=1 Tax=Chryseobacterium sp. SSA4.19 TaxID=2919915 RepID=UPI001F4E4E11|nr:glycosyltransferase [Chryseobacterium sp. SSA4.19]MCJ8155551.1 glycosyltransferase [Chryseobacterium sp. SSA4.19]
MKISIATSVYNQEKYIGTFLDAAVKIADEIIIVDHFSTDLTEEICMAYEQVKFFRKKAQSADIIRKWSIGLCTGDLNIFLDILDFNDDIAHREMMSLCSVSHSLKAARSVF